MSYMDEYDKTHRVVTINDYGREVTVRFKQDADQSASSMDSITWSGLVSLCIDAIRGLGYPGVPDGETVVDAIWQSMDEPEASVSTVPLEDLDPEVDSAAR